ncbi:MAG: hypothetical protein M0Q29_02000 [Thiopseudomonas sp.]|nr:hypothetical protein [Thiopseudomonas sp.]MCK9464642.1 hypothetical protein [Thiopseudomonas sp.]
MPANKNTPEPNDELPKLTAQSDDSIQLEPLPGETFRLFNQPSKKPRQLAIWFAIASIIAGTGGLAYSSHQRMQLLEQQLIATQDSFAKISGDAVEHIQIISGQLSTSQSSAQSDIKTLRDTLASLQKQYITLEPQLRKHTEDLSSLTKQQEQLNQRLTQQANAVKEGLLAVDAAQQQLDGQVKLSLNQLAELEQKQSQQLEINQNHSQHLTALRAEFDAVTLQTQQLEEQLKQHETSQLEVQQLQLNLGKTQAKQAELEQEFQAYRAQITRSINALNEARNP